MALELKLAIAPAVVRRPEELVARGTFTNTGSEPFRFSVVAVSAPALALSLRRVGGGEIRMAPPPVPHPHERPGDTIELAAGRSYEATYQGFLPQPLASGDYEICLRYRGGGSELRSDWMRFSSV